MTGGWSRSRVMLALATSWAVPARELADLIRREGCGRVEHMGIEGVSLLCRLGPDERARLESAFESAPDMERALKISGASVLWLGEGRYPPLLAEIPVPPAALFVKGDADSVSAPAVAIVGSRRSSSAGDRLAARLAEGLAASGFAVVSGLARGIDTAAHKGALRAGGRTVAVLGSGIDLVYPPENRPLAVEIMRRGAVVSEHGPGAEPLPWHFPLRNRLISGMALGTVVVEAAARSGALITARCALEQNRSVFAVPGKPGDPRHAGVNRLIKDGARLVESADDVLDEIAPQLSLELKGRAAAEAGPPGAGLPAGGEAEDGAPDRGREMRILDLLSDVPTHVDEISESADMEAGELAGLLLTMETRGMVKALPGKYYVRRWD